jgi:hypothetical protein
MYRILTENKNLDQILPLIQDGTVYSAIGLWHGVKEKSLVIEITGEPLRVIESIAREIKVINNQEAVMIQEIPDQTELV